MKYFRPVSDLRKKLPECDDQFERELDRADKVAENSSKRLSYEEVFN